MIDTPESGLPAMSLTTPVTVFCCAAEKKEMKSKERKKVSLRRELWPGEGVMCSMAVVLEVLILSSNLVKKLKTISGLGRFIYANGCGAWANDWGYAS